MKRYYGTWIKVINKVIPNIGDIFEWVLNTENIKISMSFTLKQIENISNVMPFRVYNEHLDLFYKFQHNQLLKNSKINNCSILESPYILQLFPISWYCYHSIGCFFS